MKACRTSSTNCPKSSSRHYHRLGLIEEPQRRYNLYNPAQREVLARASILAHESLHAAAAETA